MADLLGQGFLPCRSLLLHLAFICCRGFCLQMRRGIGPDLLAHIVRCFYGHSTPSIMCLSLRFACPGPGQVFQLALASRCRLGLEALVCCLSCDFQDLAAKAVRGFSCHFALGSSSLPFLTACGLARSAALCVQSVRPLSPRLSLFLLAHPLGLGLQRILREVCPLDCLHLELELGVVGLLLGPRRDDFGELMEGWPQVHRLTHVKTLVAREGKSNE
eukprot:s38_g6.t1